MITGPEGSVYDGGIFNLEIDFPPEYPFKARARSTGEGDRARAPYISPVRDRAPFHPAPPPLSRARAARRAPRVARAPR